MVDTGTKNDQDAKVDAVRSQNDARFAEVLAKVDGVSSKIDAIPKTITFWEAAGIAASAVIVLITVLGVYSAQFSAGVNSLGLLDKAAEVQKSRDDAQDQKLDRILDKLIVITPKP